jgi:tRNA dimethylallyltransferase
MQGVTHHVIDVADANSSFTVSDYKRLAEPILNELFAKGKIPIICGGTGFYINSLLYDLSYGNGEANLEVREKYKKLAMEKGNVFVHEELKRKDPETANKLHYNDLKRVIRALEIFENGKKKSEIVDEYQPKFEYDAYSISHERNALYERINLRVEQMIDGGLIDEVKGLLASGINITDQCMQGIGYKEVIEYLDGKIDLEQLKELIKLNTRHYAKRQITFFKKLPNVTHLTPEPIEILAKRIVDSL